MFAASLSRLRPAAARSSRVPSLQRRLQHLKQTNYVAEGQLRERRRLQRLLRDTRKTAQTGGSASEHNDEASARAIRLLPRNDALEAAMALSISENRDARTELELVRRLINSTLLSLASPVDRKWDPYDVKPQVFALNTYIALPVFTSIQYLQLFCERFGFPVRDPSGVLWASGATGTADDVRIAGLLPDGVMRSEWWGRRHAQQWRATEVSVEGAYEGKAARDEAPDNNGDRKSGEIVTAAAAPATAHSCDSSQASTVESALLTGKPHTSKEAVSSSWSGPEEPSPAVVAPPESPIDAASLFDAMMMDGVADDTLAPPVKASKKTKRHQGRSSRSASASTVHVARPPRGCKGGSHARLSKRRLRRRPLLGSRDSRAQRSKVTASSAETSSETKEKRCAEEAAMNEESAAKSAYWQTVAQTAPFELKQATPLPTFGPFLRPFLLGYFADISTLLHNAAIVPEKVDVVVNPGSPIEFVLARAATDRVLHKAQLLHFAYLKVEKELQREFSAFFSLYCPEVLYASSACVPLPMHTDEVEEGRRAARTTVNGRSTSSSNPLQEYRERTRLLREAEYRNGVAYELTILIQSTALEETFMKIQEAKHRSILMGHADLDVLPDMAAAPHVREMAQLFYDGGSELEKRSLQQSIAPQAPGESMEMKDDGGSGRADFQKSSLNHSATSTPSSMGVFVSRGTPRTINVAQSADSYFHDPTNAYTEAHAVFTEDLKMNRRR